MQIIRKNFTLKLLALGLALVGWAYLRFAGNPIAAARFAQQISVPITSANLPVGYVAHYTEREAVVTVEEGRGDPPVKPDDVKAVLDLANKGPGVYNVPITLVAPAVAVQSLSPASVTLTVERIETRAYAPSIYYSGNQTAGIVVAGSQLQPKTVSVSGATTMLAQVAAVQLDVTMPAEPKTLDEMVRPVAINSSGQEVAGLVVSPDLVRVQVRFAAGRGAGNP